MAKDPPSIQDVLARHGRATGGSGRLVNLPIEQGSTLLFDDVAAFESARASRYEHGTLYYGRYGTPARFALEAMMAELEGAEGCTATSSGVTAVGLALMSALKAGDHVLVADNVYHNTRAFADHVLTRFGVEVDYFDPMIGEAVAGRMRPHTAAVFFEAPGSGTFEVPDIPAVSAAARAHRAVSILDGTWATPVFCRPLALGVDMVVHSGSKYIGGHSDTMIGFLTCNAATWQQARHMAMTFGERPGALDVTLSLRGLRTLEMRMRHAQEAGLTVARWLSEQPEVLRVLHPAFPDCPGHAHWARDFSGAAGLFSIVLRPSPEEKVRAFIDGLSLFGIGASWGGYESLVLPMVPHRTATSWTEQGPVVRFSIGNESVESLIADIAAGLRRLG